jgi:hypothetical protein
VSVSREAGGDICIKTDCRSQARIFENVKKILSLLNQQGVGRLNSEW